MFFAFRTAIPQLDLPAIVPQLMRNNPSKTGPGCSRIGMRIQEGERCTKLANTNKDKKERR
jgi:hypothetical protein